MSLVIPRWFAGPGGIVRVLRERRNSGTSIHMKCPGCGSNRPHAFYSLDRSLTGSAFTDASPIVGNVLDTFARKVFRCGQCGKTMYESGEETVELG